MQMITANKNDAGQRLDKFLAKYLNQAPKSFFYKMLRKKNIVLNGKKASGSEILTVGDEIKLFLSDETINKFRLRDTAVTYPVTGLSILYEDDHIAIINKPAGMLSQRADDDTPSLVEYFIGYLLSGNQIQQKDLERFKPSVCNRLDRNTSGIVAAGKTLAGLQDLSEMFRERTVDKYYYAFVKGAVKEKAHIRGILRKDTARNQVYVDVINQNDLSENHVSEGNADRTHSIKNQTHMTVSEHADTDHYIETSYEPVAGTAHMTLLRVKLITGKTHQIRSHLASIGHPIAGDPKYGNRKTNQYFEQKYGLKQQLLHACEIHFPEDKVPDTIKKLAGCSILAPLPDIYRKVLDGEGIEVI